MMYHGSMLTKFLAIIGSVSATTLFVVMQLTTPASIHPVGLLGVFVLIYVVFTTVVTLGLYIGSRIFVRLASGVAGTARLRGEFSIRRAYLYGTILAFAPVVIIGMRSVGSLSVVDVLLVAMFELVACFYIWRR